MLQYKFQLCDRLLTIEGAVESHSPKSERCFPAETVSVTVSHSAFHRPNYCDRRSERREICNNGLYEYICMPKQGSINFLTIKKAPGSSIVMLI